MITKDLSIPSMENYNQAIKDLLVKLGKEAVVDFKLFMPGRDDICRPQPGSDKEFDATEHDIQPTTGFVYSIVRKKDKAPYLFALLFHEPITFAAVPVGNKRYDIIVAYICNKGHNRVYRYPLYDFLNEFNDVLLEIEEGVKGVLEAEAERSQGQYSRSSDYNWIVVRYHTAESINDISKYADTEDNELRSSLIKIKERQTLIDKHRAQVALRQKIDKLEDSKNKLVDEIVYILCRLKPDIKHDMERLLKIQEELTNLKLK